MLVVCLGCQPAVQPCQASTLHCKTALQKGVQWLAHQLLCCAPTLQIATAGNTAGCTFRKRGSRAANSCSMGGTSWPAAARFCTKSPVDKEQGTASTAGYASTHRPTPDHQFKLPGVPHRQHAYPASLSEAALAAGQERMPPAHPRCASHAAVAACMQRPPCRQRGLCGRCGAHVCRCLWLHHS